MPYRMRDSRSRLKAILVGIAGVAIPLALWAWLPLTSFGAGDLQGRIDRTRAKIEARKQKENNYVGDIASYTRRIRAMRGDILQLVGRQRSIQSDLNVKRDKLVAIQTDLRKARADLVALRSHLAKAQNVLAARLRTIYEQGEPNMTTVLLESDGFTQLVENGDALRQIGKQDQAIILAVKDAKAKAQKTTDRLAALEKDQQSVTQQILERRNAVARVKQRLLDQRRSYSEVRSHRQEALNQTRAERRYYERHLNTLEDQQAKIQAKLQASSGGGGPRVFASAGGSGRLSWPVNGPVTSEFCERRSWENCHPGMDIGVPAGTPVRAADDGRVALVQSAGASGGYGNFVCVQHTASMSTCYAHLSSIGVSVGQSVSQGETLGQSGCTGLCFGDHLHFEVRINGAVTNPRAYLP